MTGLPHSASATSRNFVPSGLVPLVAFSAAALGAGMGRAIVTTYLPVLLERIRDAPGLIGTVMLVNAAAGFAVPLWIGLWSDSLARRGRGRTLPFVVGGSALAGLGLAAIALGSGTSYLLLAAFAAVVYTGLNSVTTAHRALVPETFEGDRRARAIGAEELAMLAGGLTGVVAGGVLLELAPWAPFALAAVVLPLSAVVTAVRMRGVVPEPVTEPARHASLRELASLARAPAVRGVLTAQALWVLGYLGLPPFFVIYADRVLGLEPAAAGIALAAFGVATGAAMLGAGAVPEGAYARFLALGVVLVGVGLLSVAPASDIARAAPGLLAAGVGFGLVSTLGFPLLARTVPHGEEGAYTGVYFSVRAIAAAVAVPAAGWTIALTGSYRALVVFGGVATLLALAPLAPFVAAEARRELPHGLARRLLAWVLAVTALVAASALAGLLVVGTPLESLDHEVFKELDGGSIGGGYLSVVLDEIAFANYLALLLVAMLVGLRRNLLLPTTLLVAGSGLLAWGVVRGVWAVWDRARPEEILASQTVHSWAHVPSFPSGHVAVTVAMVAAIGRLFPGLAIPLWAYAVLLSASRISFGAHFPSDVVVGFAIGLAATYLVRRLLTGLGVELHVPSVRVSGQAIGRRGRRSRSLGRAGLAGGLAALALFGLLALTVGFPQNPDGSLLPPGVQVQAQVAALAIVAIGLLGAASRPEIGGAVVVAGALVIGILAAFQYVPLIALLAFLAFFVPGAALVGSGVRSAAGLVGAVFAGVLVLAAGGVTAASAHRYLLGPTHPESTLRLPSTDEVEWAWAGATTPTGFTVKAKLDDPPGDVRLDVARADGTHAALVAGRVSADDERTVAFEVRGLRPDTAYRYALVVDGDVDSARTGTVRTFPAGAASFSFAVSSCARIGSNGAVFDAIREEEPLLFLATGDLFYGNVSEDDPAAFRHFYDRLLGQPGPSALFRSTSLAYVWDDHDFGPDGADRTSASAPAAKSVYRERVPHYALPSSDGAIFQRFDVGRVRFLLTDTRSQRDPAYDRDGPGKTMLGAEQRAWLERELLRARDEAALTVWVSSVPWIGRAEPGNDTWAGYAYERRELADFVARNGITNLLMLSGDAHMLAIDTGAHSGYARAGVPGFPVFHAAPLDKRPGVKGGPYSLGPVLESGQFGVVTVADRGSELRVVLSGRDHDGREVLRYELSAPASTS